MVIDSRCKCSMSISVLGEGCRYCQPQTYIDHLDDTIKENEMDSRGLKRRAIVKHKREIARLKEEIRILEQLVPLAQAVTNTCYSYLNDGANLLEQTGWEALHEYEQFKLQQKLNKKGRG